MGKNRHKKPPKKAKPADKKVVSIVPRIDEEQVALLQEKSSKMHVREMDAYLEGIELQKQIETLDVDAALLEADRSLEPAEARVFKARMRCIRGMQHCLRGDVAAGYAEWARVSADMPKLAFPHVCRARWVMISDPRAALPHFDRAVEAEPGDPDLYFRRADCYEKLGDHERAIANYRRALALNPSSIDGLYAMGKALVANGDPAEAVKFYDRAIARAPRYVDFYVNRGIALQVSDRHADAIRDYDSALELDPSRSDAKFFRAKARIHLGDNERAARELADLAAIESTEHSVHLELGKVLRAMNQPAAALPSLSRAVELAPDDVEARGARGLLLMELGELESALVDLERAVELAPDRLDHVASLTDLYNRLAAG